MLTTWSGSRVPLTWPMLWRVALGWIRHGWGIHWPAVAITGAFLAATAFLYFTGLVEWFDR